MVVTDGFIDALVIEIYASHRAAYAWPGSWRLDLPTLAVGDARFMTIGLRTGAVTT